VLLSSKQEALSSIPSTSRKIRGGKGRGGRGRRRRKGHLFEKLIGNKAR
jgi:hypothetical protein